MSYSIISEHINDSLVNIVDTGRYYTKISRERSRIDESIVVSIGNISAINERENINSVTFNRYHVTHTPQLQLLITGQGYRTMFDLRNNLNFMISYVSDITSLRLSSIHIKYLDPKYDVYNTYTSLKSHPMDEISTSGMTFSDICEIHIRFLYPIPDDVKDFIESYVGDSVIRKFTNKVKKVFRW